MQRIVLVETGGLVAIVEKPVKDQRMNSEKSLVWDSLYGGGILLVFSGRAAK